LTIAFVAGAASRRRIRLGTLTQINAAGRSEAHDEPARAAWPPQDCRPRTMNARLNAQPDAAVDAAIAKVLAAELAAADAVARANLDAAAITDEARDRARAIAQRTERRMERVRAAFETATRAVLGDIAAAVDVTDHRELASPTDQDRIAAAVGALASTLTGGRSP